MVESSHNEGVVPTEAEVALSPKDRRLLRWCRRFSLLSALLFVGAMSTAFVPLGSGWPLMAQLGDGNLFTVVVFPGYAWLGAAVCAGKMSVTVRARTFWVRFPPVACSVAWVITVIVEAIIR